MASAIRDPDPVVFLEPKRSYRAFKEEVPESADDLPIGKAQVVRQGTDLTVVSWGAMMRPVIQAVEDVASARSVTIELIDLLTLAPMDAEAVASSVRKTGRLVVVQESPRSFGVASEVIAQVNDRSFLYLEAPVKRVTGYDVVTPYFGRENLYIPGVERIRNGIEETLDF
jgi:pyruvate dehydrogenase E1 component beta subunit